jgi:NAD-dependent deacetylase
MPRHHNIVVLTGSGISAESGIATFRDTGGIWAKYDYREVATPEGFARNPELVHEFYNMRIRSAAGVAPNAAHRALARLEREHTAQPGCSFALVTQNVDPLHEAAGSTNVIHMHGELAKVLCARCGARARSPGEISTEIVCSACGKAGGMRPDVVWFGEMPYHMDRIAELLAKCDLFVSIGTSGTVYPAAGFVAEARRAGAHTVELNLEPSHGVSLFHEAIHGKASEVVPTYVERELTEK